MNNHLPDCIVKLIKELENIPDVSNAIVSEAVVKAGITEEDLVPFSSFSHPASESYGRRLLYESGKFRILLMTWDPGDFTAIHNHGETEWGGVCFFGTATHRLYRTDENRVELSRKDIFEKGQIASVCGDLTHMMGNSGEKSFMTLHIYGSNQKINESAVNEKVFIPENKLIAESNGPAFLNLSPAMKLKEYAFSSYTEETLLDYFKLVKPFYARIKRDDLLQAITSYEMNINIYYR